MTDAVKADLDSGALDKAVADAISDARKQGVAGDDIPTAVAMAVVLAYTAQLRDTLLDAAGRERG
jgi:hypothetical protein